MTVVVFYLSPVRIIPQFLFNLVDHVSLIMTLQMPNAQHAALSDNDRHIMTIMI